MATYNPLYGETLYDVAVNLYDGDAVAGIQDLLENNPTVNLNADDQYGVTLTYTPGIVRKKPVFPEAEPLVPVATYRTREKQSVYDLAIQLYGDYSKIGNLLELFPNLDNKITAGSTIEIEEQDDPQAQYFKDEQIIVATDI